MASIDVSSRLADYMLKGWVLTDQICATPGCQVPLLRSPKSSPRSYTLCANCEKDTPESATTSNHSSQSSSQTSISDLRSSTPLTEVSSSMSVPSLTGQFNTAESIQRRQQSDVASRELGNRLLRGWAMLADECPNETCYGVPLVRPPMPGGKDPRKECVVCGTVYIDEKDLIGQTSLVSVKQPENATSSVQIDSRSIGIEAHSSDPQALRMKSSNASQKVSAECNTIGSSIASSPVIMLESASALDVSITALSRTLRALSDRLVSLSDSVSIIDPDVIVRTVDAMSKVYTALAQAQSVRSDAH